MDIREEQQFQNDNSYEEFEINLTTLKQIELQVDADYIALIDVNTDVLRVQVNRLSSRRLRLGSVIRPNGAIRRIVVSNPSGGTVTGTLVYGKGAYLDNRSIVTSIGGAITVKGNDASGSAPTVAPCLIAGQDGTNVRTILTDTTGRPKVDVAAINGVTPLMGAGVPGTGSPRVTVATNGATSKHHAISAATTNATSVKASAGTINTLSATNINAAARYLKLYDKASAPVVGTDTPAAVFLLKPGETTVIPCGPAGRGFSTGIAYALTTGLADADTGAVAVTEHSVELSYV